MPVILAILGLVLAAGVWAWRIRMARQALDDVSMMASDVIAAARRLGFRRRLNTHPVDSVDEPELAMAAVGVAFLDLASMPTAEQLAGLKQSLSRHLGVSEIKADEMMIVGRWLVNECKGATSAVSRLTKRLYQLDQGAFTPLLVVLNDIGQSGGGLGPRQRDALDDIARIMRLN